MGDMKRPKPQYLLDREGARDLDRCAIEQHGIAGIELMENAAIAATTTVRNRIDPGSRVLILVGRGNNGGDGWAMARLLHEAGHEVGLHTLGDARPGSDAAHNQKRAEALSLDCSPTLASTDLQRAALVVDALYGTGLDRPIEGMSADWIRLVNASDTAVLAIDLPSGLDADQGVPLGPTIEAARTVTFVAPKLGMVRETAARYCGSIEVASIGTPDSLLERFGVPAAG
jgi:hydroxyethylthiazole kinase-like uncharacterized protein yjeF